MTLPYMLHYSRLLEFYQVQLTVLFLFQQFLQKLRPFFAHFEG